jgi:hypothetical protein
MACAAERQHRQGIASEVGSGDGQLYLHRHENPLSRPETVKPPRREKGIGNSRPGDDPDVLDIAVAFDDLALISPSSLTRRGDVDPRRDEPSTSFHRYRHTLWDQRHPTPAGTKLRQDIKVLLTSGTTRRYRRNTAPKKVRHYWQTYRQGELAEHPSRNSPGATWSSEERGDRTRDIQRRLSCYRGARCYERGGLKG